MVFGVVSSEGHIMPPHIFEVGLKVNTKVYLDVLKSVVLPWCNQVTGGRPWVWQQDLTPANKSQKDPSLASGVLRLLYSSLTGLLPPLTWTRWTTLFVKLCLKKINLVSYPARAEGLVNMRYCVHINWFGCI